MGWFFGFKSHIAIDEKGKLIGVNLTKGNIDDRNQDVLSSVLNNASRNL